MQPKEYLMLYRLYNWLDSLVPSCGPGELWESLSSPLLGLRTRCGRLLAVPLLALIPLCILAWPFAVAAFYLLLVLPCWLAAWLWHGDRS